MVTARCPQFPEKGWQEHPSGNPLERRWLSWIGIHFADRGIRAGQQEAWHVPWILSLQVVALFTS
jgi:hypothetical protein